MATVEFLTIVGGKRTQSVSTGMTPSFTGITIGADNLAIAEGGTGGTAYFDFGSRSLHTSFTPATSNDLVNYAFVTSNYAPLASPTFTGTPAAPTPGSNINTTQIATTAWVNNWYAPLASPSLSGTPTAPTATSGTNTTQIATTAFVQSAIGALSFTTWLNAAIDIGTNTPPGSPTTGDRHVVGTSPTGAWAGQANNVAQWSGSAWVFTTPTNGTFIDVLSYSGGVYFFNGTSWATKSFEASTASLGIRIVGVDVERDDAITVTNDNAGSITAGTFVYIKSNGHVDVANGSGSTVGDSQIGVVDEGTTIATTASGRVNVRDGHIVTGLSGLTPGAKYYLSNTTGGVAVLYSANTWVTGDSVICVGQALTTSTLLFMPEFCFFY